MVGIRLDFNFPEYTSQDAIHVGLIGRKRLKTVLISIKFMFTRKNMLKKASVNIDLYKLNSIKMENMEQANLLIKELISQEKIDENKTFFINDIRNFMLPQEKISNALIGLLILGSPSIGKSDAKSTVDNILTEYNLDSNFTVNLLKTSIILEMLFKCAIDLGYEMIIHFSDKSSLNENSFKKFENYNNNTFIEILLI